MKNVLLDILRRTLVELDKAYGGLDSLPPDHPAVMMAVEARVAIIIAEKAEP